MSYFTNFAFVPYRFGTSSEVTLHQNMSQYVDILDRIKDNNSFYSTYQIQDGERPDTLSYKVYKSVKYYWTFFLINDGIREQGWPLTKQEVLAKVKTDKPNTVLTTRADLSGIFKVGSSITGISTGQTGKIIKRNLDLGQIFIEGSKSFSGTESIQTTEGSLASTVTLVSAVDEHNGVSYYTDPAGVVDIDPYTGPGHLLTPVTFYDEYYAQNESLKIVKILKPDVIETVFSEFQTEMAK